MPELHVHVDGSAADHAEWGVDVWARDDADVFDAAALERAIAAERAAAYASLRDLDAA